MMKDQQATKEAQTHDTDSIASKKAKRKTKTDKKQCFTFMNLSKIRENIRCNGLYIHGRHIDFAFVNENASDSIFRNDESDSIEIDESDLQSLKQDEPRISTVHGMRINVSRE
jgi:hypothetical protein